MFQPSIRQLLFVVLVMLLPSALPAQNPETGSEEGASADSQATSFKLPRHVRLYSIGTVAAGDSDGNRYLSGDEQTEAENFDFTMVAIANPTEKWTVFGQVSLSSETGDYESAVDYLFAERALTDNLSLAFGRAHHSFGIYGEISKIGTLRPLLSLPQGIYGASGMVGDNYTGITLKHSHSFSSSWLANYDIYAGGIDIRVSRPWIALMDPRFPRENEHSEIEDTIGGRFDLSHPNGFSVGVSGYHGTQQSGSGGWVSRGPHDVYGGHIQYLSDHWHLRAEVARHDHLQARTIDGAYLEVAYSFLERWQAAARYDWGEVNIDGFKMIAREPSLWDHRDVTLGLSYWVRSGLVLRAEIHDVEGNRFALPADLAAAIRTGGLRSETQLLRIGVQFRF